MPQMNDRIFLDTNILVYLYSGDEPEKQAAALSLVEQNNPVISTQVLSELANTLSRKFNLGYDVVVQAIAEIQDACTVIPVMPLTIARALALAQKYQTDLARSGFGHRWNPDKQRAECKSSVAR
jgi:predicted nucleic acid-binding protein